MLRPAAELVRRAALLSDSWPQDPDSTAPGAYLARTSCTECHGLNLRGGDQAPDLRIAAGYSFDTFMELMWHGKALGNRELPLMSQVARGRFRHFTDQEPSRSLHVSHRASSGGRQEGVRLMTLASERARPSSGLGSGSVELCGGQQDRLQLICISLASGTKPLEYGGDWNGRSP